METSEINKAVSEIADDVVLARQVAAAIKAKDLATLTKLAPEVARELGEDFAAVKAALPEIKAGYKTTEFWLTLGVLALNGGWFALKGEALPFDVNAVLSALVGVYAIVRGLTKKAAV
jgi:hypothetical protein